ncbi:class I SAM-dependent methyltransferase [Alsobacter sp. SYSU M60028]|uniref:Class I SAM-dependent methyltransferase n=1 Tax=Alsobacter ponti TaxID=2962936 RepID=A0ABT1LA53_9HYPH|nr:class I SAM-dependent methyltransferase [Alsobacter ponti]MCP8938387.1 class I SAM-dependent methyltransferase [Alsobacter ponti]
MSGFSPDWLALREPADLRARDAGLLGALARRLAGREAVTIVDLGCGAGSNLRALAPALDVPQRWRLVDHDPRLLDAARQRLAAWGGGAADGAGLALTVGGRRSDVEFRQADLAQSVDAALDPTPDLVTAAAFFDLVSENWIERFVQTLAARRLPLYAVLTYDGEERWSPPHAADASVLAAFHAHQGRDKGFGPAAGPRAAATLEAALRRHGYAVATAASPWRLGGAERELIRQLADGIAAAAADTGRVPPEVARNWAAARRVALSALIGHVDVLALPPS